MLRARIPQYIDLSGVYLNSDSLIDDFALNVNLLKDWMAPDEPALYLEKIFTASHNGFDQTSLRQQLLKNHTSPPYIYVI